jgi:hypothetical protein
MSYEYFPTKIKFLVCEVPTKILNTVYMGARVDSSFYPEDGDSTFPRIVGAYLPNNTGFHTVVGIATRLGPDGSGFEPRGGKRYYLLHTRPDRSWGPSSLLYQCVP